jgi:glutamate racemase
VFDSGVGGLSVLRQIRAALPREDLLYVADSGHAPYGSKPLRFIEERFWTSGDSALTGRIIARLWQRPARVEPLPASFGGR